MEAVGLCKLIEDVAPLYGCHVALTGGTLYKPGQRKDCDILFYRIRQEAQIDRDGLVKALTSLGLEMGKEFGWMQKATFNGKKVDIFFPEHLDAGEYPEE